MKEERIVKLEHKYPITIGLIADMHCGTTRALMLDEYVTLEGQTIKANKVQRILHKHWLKVSEIFKKYEKPVLMINPAADIESEAVRVLEEAGIPVYMTPERAADVMAVLYRRRRYLERVGAL